MKRCSNLLITRLKHILNRQFKTQFTRVRKILTLQDSGSHRHRGGECRQHDQCGQDPSSPKYPSPHPGAAAYPKTLAHLLRSVGQTQEAGWVPITGRVASETWGSHRALSAGDCTLTNRAASQNTALSNNVKTEGALACVTCSVASDFCDPMNCSPPGSPVHAILQVRILEWVARLFSRGSSQSRDWTQVSCTVQADSLPSEPNEHYNHIYIHRNICMPASTGDTEIHFKHSRRVSQEGLKKDEEPFFFRLW